MSYQQEIEWLYNLQRFGDHLGLKRIKKILEKLGNPQDSFRSIHIAGTNGKGSTAAMLAEILKNAGHKTGLYTSPYIIDFRERIQINNRYIPKKDLLNLIKKIKKQDIHLTFFEFTTTLAFLYFKEKNVRYAVIETGLGGRLDATNTLNSLISIITNISKEHTQQLGNTIEKIAKEKSAIIKPNSTIITTAKGDALKIIEKTAKKQKSTLIIPKSTNKTISLKGEFQKQNASLAIQAAKTLKIKQNIINQSLKQVFWPGRLEKIDNFILDCAHNPAAIKQLKKHFKNPKMTIIFGVLKDKDYNSMIKHLPKHRSIILTKPKIKRALDPDKLKIKNSTTIKDIKDAVLYAKKHKPKNSIILVTGSCYTVSEARSFLF